MNRIDALDSMVRRHRKLGGARTTNPLAGRHGCGCVMAHFGGDFAKWLLVLLGIGAWHASAAAGQGCADQPVLRRPIALQQSPDQRYLYVANERAGTLSIVDVERQAAMKEIELGRRLSDLTAVGNNLLLASDEASHELIVLAAKGADLDVKQRLPVSPYPVNVVATRDGLQAVVASLWSRQLTFVELGSDRPAVALRLEVIDLPFAPRCQLLVANDTRLIVADSFAGRLAVIDMDSRRLLHIREIPGHNIRGLGMSPDGRMLIVAHQMLNELAHTVQNDVHWGLLMSNDLRWLPLVSILTPDADLYAGAHMHPLGQAGKATGDPAGLAVGADGTVVVSLGGVGEIAIGQEHDFALHRVSVGQRPTDVLVGRDTRQAYVVNTFAESVSVIDLTRREPIAEISLGSVPELSLADRGELLFYDARLSHDRWMSCSSCHTDGHSNGQLNDNFSDQSFGAPKRILSLLGRRETAPFAWNGTALTLADQTRTSIENTMQSDHAAREGDVHALVAYLESLPPPPSLDELRGRSDRKAISRGETLFAELDCATCHAPPHFTTPQRYDVSLTDELGNSQFNPPPLVGVSQRTRFFHDNRAADLADVFQRFGHQLNRELADSELSDLLAFLRSL